MNTNDFTVFTVKAGIYDDPPIKAVWLGNHRYQCGHCMKGYFNVFTEDRYDISCPSCGFYIVVRYTGR